MSAVWMSVSTHVLVPSECPFEYAHKYVVWVSVHSWGGAVMGQLWEAADM